MNQNVVGGTMNNDSLHVFNDVPMKTIEEIEDRTDGTGEEDVVFLEDCNKFPRTFIDSITQDAGQYSSGEIHLANAYFVSNYIGGSW